MERDHLGKKQYVEVGEGDFKQNTRYTRWDEFGKIRGRYGQDGVSGVLNKNIYLQLILFISGGANSNKLIKSGFEKLMKKKISTSNINKPLNYLEKIKILDVGEFKSGKRGRREKKYKLNYLEFSKFLINKLLF